jgi:REP-associated tyrosine transposase
MPYFHVWFATKRRKRMLQEGDVLDAMRELILSIAAENSIALLEFEAVIDHVHLLLELKDKSELPRAMMMLKGVSSRRIFERYPQIRLDAQTTSFWQAGYGSKIIPPSSVPALQRYIKTQWDKLEGFER